VANFSAPNALDVFSFRSVYADHFALLNEVRYADDQSCFQFGWLQNVADGGGRHSRVCLHNTKIHCGRKLHPKRAAVVKIDFDFRIWDEIVDCVAEDFLTEM